MRSPYHKQNNVKVVIYAVILALVLGVCAIAMQDIQAPTEHVSKDISVNLEK